MCQEGRTMFSRAVIWINNESKERKNKGKLERRKEDLETE